MKYSITFATNRLDELKVAANSVGLNIGRRVLDGKVYSTGKPFQVVTLGSPSRKMFPVIEKMSIDYGV